MRDDVDVGELSDGPGELVSHLVRRRGVPVGDTRPDRMSGSLFRHHHGRPHEAIHVRRTPVLDTDAVHHGVAVEGVDVRPDRIEPRVWSIAQIAPGQRLGQFTCHRQVGDVDLGSLWRKDPGEMIVVGEFHRRWSGRCDGHGVHSLSSHLQDKSRVRSPSVIRDFSRHCLAVPIHTMTFTANTDKGQRGYCVTTHGHHTRPCARFR